MRVHPLNGSWVAGVLCASLAFVGTGGPSGVAAIGLRESDRAGAVAHGGPQTDRGSRLGEADGATRGTDAGRRRTEAARLMARSIESIRRHRLTAGRPLDPEVDPNETGLIGDEFTPLTTSLGDVAAKRTCTNPAFAAAVAGMLADAGLRPGDVVAVGASGSFPALLLATLCASRALDLEPVVIYSMGASMYGANLPGFTFVEMLAGLRQDGVLPYRLAAVSPGGAEDTGRGVLFDEDGTTLLDEARGSGLPIVAAETLAENIQQRLRLYEAGAAGRPIRAFVNVGGASASFGRTPSSLDLANGFVRRPPPVPASPVRGVLFEFVARGVPVVHLLHVGGLARDHGLPYDPVPAPWAARAGLTRPVASEASAAPRRPCRSGTVVRADHSR